MIIYETDYLAHHGVKGMKWGVRKQRVLKGKKRGQTASSIKASSKKKWSTKKKVAVGGAIAAGTALAAIGGYAIYKNTKRAKAAKAGYLAAKQAAALNSLAEQGKRAMNSGSLSYFAENPYGKVVGVRSATGYMVNTFKKG